VNTDNATIIRFGKQFYCMHADMIRWCYAEVGTGGWGPTDNDNDSLWMITCNFGTTTFYFRNPEDALAFKLKFLCYAIS
jgi:hypothetical protein